ncbi:hypothetical protein L195_g040362, partial [Trifolium pratense]
MQQLEDDDWDGQISIPSKMAMIEPLANQYVVNDEDWDETSFRYHDDDVRKLPTDLMNKLWSAKKTQAHIDSETSTANAQIQIDDLKSVMKICDVQKMKLKSECTEWAQQSFIPPGFPD